MNGDEMPDELLCTGLIFDQDRGNVERIGSALIQENHREADLPQPCKLRGVNALCEHDQPIGVVLSQ